MASEENRKEETYATVKGSPVYRSRTPKALRILALCLALLLVGELVLMNLVRVDYSAKDYKGSAYEEVAEYIEENDEYLNENVLRRMRNIVRLLGEPRTNDEYSMFASVAIADKNYGKAIEYLEHVIANYEGDSKDLAALNIKLGCLCAMLDQWKKAAATFRTALEQDPENTQGYLMLTEACYNDGDYPAAAEALRTFSTLQPMNGEQWATLTSLDMANEDYENAVDSCTKTLENGDCDRADLYYMRSKANYFLKNYDAARADADASVAAGGDYTENMTLKAASCEQEGDYAGILAVLLDMIDHGDADISVYQNALQCAYNTENYPAQVKILQLLMEYDADAETRQMLVKSLATARFRTGDYAGAEENFAECVEAEPESAELIYLLGLCRQNNGKYKEAEKDFSTVIEMDQMVDESMYNRAVCRLSAGNSAGANADLLAIVTRNQDENIVALAKQLLGQE